MIQTTSTLSDRTIERANAIATATGSLEIGIVMAAKVKGCQRKRNLNCINYYDVERGEFRCCLVSNLVLVF